MKHIFSSLILLLLLIPYKAISSGFPLSRHISDIPVFAIVADNNDIVWVGTENGLLRYDSKNFKKYTFNPTDTTSLSDNSIRSLLVDSHGRLWVGTRNGLNLYNPSQDNFIQFLPDNNHPEKLNGRFIKSLVEDYYGMIWIATESEGLSVLNPDNMRIRNIAKSDNGGNLSSNNIEKAAIDREGAIWIATRIGLNYKKPDGTWQFFPVNNQPFSRESTNDIVTIAPDKNSGIWISSRDTTLHHLSLSGKLISVNTSQLVSTLYSDDQNNLFLGTVLGGLWKIAPGDSYPGQIEELIERNRELGAIRDIFIDRWQNKWIGAENGLFIHFANQRQFYGIKTENLKNNLSDISSLFEDNKGRTWIASRSKLLIREGTQWNSAQEIYPSLSKMQGFIYKLYETSNNSLWVGTFGHGLYHLDTNTGKLENFLLSDYLPKAPRDINNIWDIKQDKKGNLWIGTWGGGLVHYDTYNKSFAVYKHDHSDPLSLSSNKILSLLTDTNNKLWIGTDGGGLNSFCPESRTFTRHNLQKDHKAQILDRSILCLHEDSNGLIWIGSDGGGLLRYDPANDHLYVYNHLHGLINQSVKMILEDDSHNLWVSTNGGGIFRFDPQLENFVQFTQNDGLSSNRFQNGAGFKNHEGQLYFGGAEGFTFFNPASVTISDYSPRIMVTKILINNEKNDKSGNIYLHRFNQNKEIRLRPSDQLLSLDFTAIEYSPREHNYRYRLKGLNDKWINLGEYSHISLINLPHGKYTLELQSTNSDGLWTDNTHEIKVKVLPPLYKTPYFIVILMVVLLLSLYALHLHNVKGMKKRRQMLEKEVLRRTERINQQRNKLHKQNRILLAQKDELTARNKKIIDSTERIRLMTKKLHESDVMKIKFFTNISHEIRTPLTLVIGPLDQLIKKHSEAPEKERSTDIDYLLTMRHNAGKILRLFDQIITFRKMESGSLKLCKKRSNLPEFLNDIFFSFKDYAALQNIEMDFNDHTGGIVMDFDHEKTEKIFTNLLSNAIKFNKEHGKITVEVNTRLEENKIAVKDGETHNYKVEIMVQDTGIGIRENVKDKIFDMFYQEEEPSVHPADKGVGIGLSLAKSLVEMHNGKITVHSTPGEGSTFRFTLPIEATEAQSVKNLSLNQQNAGNPKGYIENSEKYVYQREQQSFPMLPKWPQKSVAAKDLHDKTLLVVEDNHDLCNYMANWLGEEFNILTARNGAEGLKIAEKNQPDLIITDIVMPVMGGLELLEKIKNNIETSHIPLILLSAKTSVEDKIEGMKLNADAYIAKPFHLQHLLFTVNSLMENRLLLQRKYRELFSFEPAETQTLTPDEKFLQRTKEVIEENISNPDFNINQLSKEVGVSRAGIYRKINALLNISVNTLIRNMRIRKAAKMLSTNSYYVNEIAFQVGFNDVQYFRKCFRKMYNMTPREYALKFAADPVEEENT